MEEKEIEMTEREFLTVMRAIRMLAEESKDMQEFLKKFDEITGLKKEPTPTTK